MFLFALCRNDADKYLRFEEKLYQHNELGKACSDVRSLQKHKMRKTGEKPYQYKQCEKIYSDVSEQTQAGKKTFVSKKSVKVSSTKSGVQIRKRNHGVGPLHVYNSVRKLVFLHTMFKYMKKVILERHPMFLKNVQKH